MRKLLYIIIFISIVAKAQDNYIVLSTSQKEYLDTFKLNFTECLEANHVDFVPIAIKDSLYILPTAVLTDPAFHCVYVALQERGSFERMIIRKVEEYEFITE